MTKKQLITLQMKKKMDWLLENTDYNVAFMCLQGSQNYGLDEYSEEYKSDFDVKCFVIPSLKNLLEDTSMVSKVLEMEDKSIIEVKDIRLLGKLLYKMNPTYLELLYTPYFFVNKDYQRTRTLLFLKSLKEMRDEIANRDVKRFAKAMQGFVLGKRKNLEKEKDSNKAVFDIYGYNPKELHHLVRLSLMMNEVSRLKGKVKFESLMKLDFLTKKQKETLKKYKTEPIEYTEAIHKADMYVEKVKHQVDELLENDNLVVNSVEDKMNNLIEEYVLNTVKVDVINDIKAANQKRKGAKAELQTKK